MVGAFDNHLLVQLMLNKAGRGTAPCLLPHALSNRPSHKHAASWVSFMLQSDNSGEQQLEETERVPDNYPHRLPPLSGRREHTQSNMGNQKGC